MEKTSRRNFGKQLTGALAALPVAAVLATAPGANAQTRKQAKSSRVRAKEKLSEHNTPPPLFLMPGSLLIEAATDKSDWNAYATIGNRRKWLVKPRTYPDGTEPSRIYVAHIKIVDGAGEMVFRFDNDGIDPEIPIHLTGTLMKEAATFGDCHLTVEGNSFAIDVPNVKKIKKKNNDHPTNPKRQRVRYMHDSNDDDVCDFAGLRIDKGTVNLYYNQDLMDLDGFDELKIMLWWANLP